MNGYRDYQEMVLARAGLNNIYLISLTLVLLLSMFGAIALSVIMANRISQPLMMLLEGTRKVAEGKYDLIPEVKADDEVGELARSFNRMTEQLAQTQADLVRRGRNLNRPRVIWSAFWQRCLRALLCLITIRRLFLRTPAPPEF